METRHAHNRRVVFATQREPAFLSAPALFFSGEVPRLGCAPRNPRRLPRCLCVLPLALAPPSENPRRDSDFDPTRLDPNDVHLFRAGAGAEFSLWNRDRTLYSRLRTFGGSGGE